MSTQHTPDMNDPREMRKRLIKVSYGRTRLDGKPEDVFGMPSHGVHLVRTVFLLGEAQGWSGEDTMTALAFHLLGEYERVYDLVLKQAMLNPTPFSFPVAQAASDNPSIPPATKRQT